MLGRCFFWTVFFSFIFGSLNHLHIQLHPLLNWIGTLPGDLIIDFENNLFFLPVASSFLIGLAFCLIFKGK